MRGPGNGLAGYCMMQTTATPAGQGLSIGPGVGNDLANSSGVSLAPDHAAPPSCGSPSSAGNGYEFLDDSEDQSRPSVPVSVEIVINTTGSSYTPTGNTSVTWSSPVISGDYGIAVTPLELCGDGSTAYTPKTGGTTPQSIEMTGPLPNLAGANNTYGIPSSWGQPDLRVALSGDGRLDGVNGCQH